MGALFSALLAPFAGRPVMLAAAVWGVVVGALAFVILRRLTSRAAVTKWKRRRRAQMLSLYLFGDDPVLSLRALGQIALANAVLLIFAMPGLLVAAPVVALVAVNLNEFFTLTPLSAGAPAVLTARVIDGCDPVLETPEWIRVETAAMHVPAMHAVSWRIRATAPREGVVSIRCGGSRITKELDARTGPRYWTKAEDESGPVQRIAISEALPGNGLVWFFVFTSATAWLLGFFVKDR